MGMPGVIVHAAGGAVSAIAREKKVRCLCAGPETTKQDAESQSLCVPQLEALYQGSGEAVHEGSCGTAPPPPLLLQKCRDLKPAAAETSIDDRHVGHQNTPHSPSLSYCSLSCVQEG